MNWFRRAPILVLQTPPLTSQQLTAVISSVPDDHALWMAMHQVIEEEMREAQMAAEATVADYGICASEVGGSQHLRRLRDRLWAIKAEGGGRIE
jgi:hypothetical protein